MTKTELNKFKEVLETKQAELAKVLRNREGITIEKSPDALDEVQNAAERELAIRNLDRESNLLRAVRAALHRIGQPMDVAGSVVFLASPAASLITGQTLLIDGGWTAR